MEKIVSYSTPNKEKIEEFHHKVKIDKMYKYVVYIICV